MKTIDQYPIGQKFEYADREFRLSYKGIDSLCGFNEADSPYPMELSMREVNQWLKDGTLKPI